MPRTVNLAFPPIRWNHIVLSSFLKLRRHLFVQRRHHCPQPFSASRPSAVRAAVSIGAGDGGAESGKAREERAVSLLFLEVLAEEGE
eukprot:CAMPEP_0196747008 /NCGR_PEP_ID=MMETSP1091-20130531/67967_1 /TAXON_ID=302021 /ORGANISM="Rhodomonas sp., Strain CCMP768" /LENGTH=86 /DNA_ID=CAMNT_0042094071 /DNA_START=17 /DNA_END=274 /DNA_ORIENTATION=+